VTERGAESKTSERKNNLRLELNTQGEKNEGESGKKHGGAGVNGNFPQRGRAEKQY